MAEDKQKVLYQEEIEDQPLPDLGVSKNVGSSFFSTITKFFTGLFKFGEKGGLQIGEYIDGVQGKITLDINGFHAYSTTNKELVRVNTSGLTVSGTSGSAVIIADEVGGTTYGQLGFDLNSNYISLISLGVPLYFNSSGVQDIGVQSGNDFWVTAHNNITLNATGGAIYLTSLDVQDIGVTSGNDFWVTAHNNMTFVATDGTISFSPGGDNKIELGGNLDMNGYDIDGGDTIYLNGTKISGSGGDVINIGNHYIDMNGSDKLAIVPTSKGFRSLYCTESPEVWFMDFCESKDKIDPLFLEVTVKPYHFIKCDGGEYQVWGKRKGFENKRFESKTQKEFEANNLFWSTPQRLA